MSSSSIMTNVYQLALDSLGLIVLITLSMEIKERMDDGGDDCTKCLSCNVIPTSTSNDIFWTLLPLSSSLLSSIDAFAAYGFTTNVVQVDELAVVVVVVLGGVVLAADDRATTLFMASYINRSGIVNSQKFMSLLIL